MEDSISRRVGVILPCDQPLWNKLSNEIEKLMTVNPIEIEKLRQILSAIQTISEEQSPCLSPCAMSDFIFEGFIHFLEREATPKEKKTFFERTLRTIASIALEIGHLKPQELLRYSLQQQDHTLHLSRRFTASLLAHSFLCTLPTQDMVELNQINFKYFFKHLQNLSLQKAQAAKLRCILHYFERLSLIWDSGLPSGELTFQRKVFPQNLLPSLDTWETSETPLCGFVVKVEGGMEDVGSGIIQVDFANRYIGGGVLSSGLVQEEIRFITCPELISGLPFLECLQDNEAVVISGFERYSDYSGYSQTFSYEGDFVDSAKVNPSGNLDTKLLAIDASPFYDTSDDQYRESYLLRDLNKAFIGFLPSREPEVPSREPEVPFREPEVPSIDGSDVDISFYTDATERSHYTTETDFETASESLDVPKPEKGSSYDLSHITNYGNALSKAITDIAVKDASIIQSGESSLLDESTDYSIDDSGELEKVTLNYEVDGNGDDGSLREWSQFSDHPFVSKKILNFCNQLTQEVMLSVVSSEPEGGIVKGMSHGKTLNEKGSIAEVSKSKICKESKDYEMQREHLRESETSEDTKGKENKPKVQTQLTGFVDDIVTSVVMEALHKKIPPASPTENGSNHSGVGSSLGDFSVISSLSAHSETFVKVPMEGDYGDLNPAGDKQINMVEKFVAGVIDQAISVAKKLDNIEEERNQGTSSHLQNDQESNLVRGYDLSNSNHANRACMETDQSSDHEDNRKEAMEAVAAPTHFCLNNIGNFVCDHLSSVHGKHDIDTERGPHRVPPLQGPVVNIEDGDAAMPGTPPPSPTFQQFGSSSRSSFSEAELLIFGEELLELQNQEPRNHQRMRMVETYVEEYVDADEDDDEDSELDHMIAAASRRSSSRSGSASSRPPNLDSFTEGLLKIGDIDPQGRRPSRTEESLQYFSAELAKRVEKDRYNLRRESDLDRFAFDLFHGVNSVAEPEPVRTINKDIAAVCASRLAADIMQDVAIQMFGAVFPHSVRLIPAQEGDFPPRRELSETDLLSLAANLANSILELALKTYRRDILGNISESSQSGSVAGESESELYSHCAQIDENSVCDSAIEDLQFSNLQDVPYHSVDEMAWNLASNIVSEASDDVRKIKVLQWFHQQSLQGDQCPVATGNWGCGVFGGDPQLKSLIQWMAASQAGVPTVYYFSYSDRRVEELSDVVQLLRMRGWTVGKMLHLIREYCQQKITCDLREDLFRHILNKKFTA